MEGFADDPTVDIRSKAVEVALAVASGAYQTTLLTYFIQRDLFPAIMKVCRLTPFADHEADGHSSYKKQIPHAE